MQVYDTLSQAIEGLRKEGYVVPFSILAGDIVDAKTGIPIPPDDFTIDSFYRFEGDTDPGDESIVYAISSGKLQLKGFLVNAFGTYADPAGSEALAKLHLTR